jgi:hypothetical protein
MGSSGVGGIVMFIIFLISFPFQIGDIVSAKISGKQEVVEMMTKLQCLFRKTLNSVGCSLAAGLLLA